MKKIRIIKTKEKDEIAKLLKTSPEAMKEFERAYKDNALDSVSDNFFDINSKQMTKQMKSNSTAFHAQSLTELEDRIVEELLANTLIYKYDGVNGYNESLCIPEIKDYVTNDDIKKFPEAVRPFLTGKLAKVDIKEPSSNILLMTYKKYIEEKNPVKKRQYYHYFRQGLDILDLDQITYKIIGMNMNSIGNWFPQLVEACKSNDFFKIPSTTIVKVPLPLLQLTHIDYISLTQTTLHIVDKWAQRAFGLDFDKEYFIKTGTYSSKFDFRNAYVHGEKEVRELGEYLLFIHFQALQMASSLSSPCIYGVSTTNEWVVREFIKDNEANPCIYKGLPLHTEYRIFVDCDRKEVIGISPYWEPDTMKNRFAHGEDADSPHQIHDYIMYKSHEHTLMERYHKNKDKLIVQVEKILPDLHLKGQWSLDIMQNVDDFWIIDMAVAENSALYECVPEKLRKPIDEEWIPEISDINN